MSADNNSQTSQMALIIRSLNRLEDKSDKTDRQISDMRVDIGQLATKEDLHKIETDRVEDRGRIDAIEDDLVSRKTGNQTWMVAGSGLVGNLFGGIVVYIHQWITKSH